MKALCIIALFCFNTAVLAKKIKFHINTGAELELFQIDAIYEGDNTLLPGCCERSGNSGKVCKKEIRSLRVQETIAIREQLPTYCQLKLTELQLTVTYKEGDTLHAGTIDLYRSRNYSPWGPMVNTKCSFNEYWGENLFECGYGRPYIIKDDIDEFEINIDFQ